MMLANTARRGTMLLEILVSIMLIGVLCGVFALIMNHTMRSQRLQAESFDRLQQSRALADQFRLDVARAKAAPKEREDDVADRETLILQTDAGDHIVYKWRDGVLKRWLHANDEVTERQAPVPFGMSVEFARADEHARLIRLRLTPMRDGKALAGQSIEFAAVLGGDLR